MPDKTVQIFPQGFLWGTAVAGHQVEGDSNDDWARWERGKNHVYKDIPAGRACEWWAGRYEEDFDRAAAMHNNSLRLSVEWSRIEPEKDRWDSTALDRYREMLKALRERDLVPMVTLHHFANPLWLADQGEWQNEQVVTRFERYARYVVEGLKDLCSLWCTINEPMIYATQGYSFGIWPPGTQSRAGVAMVALNMLKAHVAAYYAIKEIQPEAQVGYSTHQLGLEPAAPALLNRTAVGMVEDFFNQSFALALRDGILKMAGQRAVAIKGGKGALDWIGLQYYQVFKVGFHLLSPTSFFLRQYPPADGRRRGPPGWGGIDAPALLRHLKWFEGALHKPIYITECGVPDPDDAIRPGYLIESVMATWLAVNFNVPVRGLYFWTLLDNFEWERGYNPAYSFGLYKMNFETQERTPRHSAELCAAICKQNGLSRDIAARFAPELLDRLYPGAPGADNVKLKPPQPLGTPVADKRSTRS